MAESVENFFWAGDGVCKPTIKSEALESFFRTRRDPVTVFLSSRVLDNANGEIAMKYTFTVILSETSEQFVVLSRTTCKGLYA
jgi:hypothetical protein